MPPQHPDELPGSWRRLYRRRADLTLDRIDPRLVERCRRRSGSPPPAAVIDKRLYSPFPEQIETVETDAILAAWK